MQRVVIAHGWRVATGLTSPKRAIIGVVGDSLWLAPDGPTTLEHRLVGFDTASLEPVGEIETLATPFDGWLDGNLFAYAVETLDHIEVIDLAKRRRVNELKLDKARCAGLIAGRLVVSAATRTGYELRLVDARTAKVTQVVPIRLADDHPVEVITSPGGAIAVFGDGIAGLKLGAKSRAASFEENLDGYPCIQMTRDGDRMVVTGKRRVICIDIAGCRIAWCAKLPTVAVGDGLSAMRVRDAGVDVIAHVQRKTGPALLITPIAMESGAVGSVVERPGRFGDLPSHVYEREPPVPRATAEGGVLHVVRAGAAPVRLPLPPGDDDDPTLVAGDRVFVAGRNLIAIDLASLPARATTAGVELAPVRAAPAKEVVAEVTFAAAYASYAQHPTHGRVRLLNPGSAKIGDRIILEDVTMLPGNVVHAGGWRRAGKQAAAPKRLKIGPAQLPTATPMVVTGDPLYDVVATPIPARTYRPLTPLVKPIEALFGTKLPLLRKLAAACDADPAVRGWWEDIGSSFSLEFELPDDDEIADNLERLRFAPFTGDDRHYGVVRQPKGRARGIAGLSPEGDFDVWWDAPDFDSWLFKQLAHETRGSTVKLLLEALDLPASVLTTRTHKPPAWF